MIKSTNLIWCKLHGVKNYFCCCRCCCTRITNNIDCLKCFGMQTIHLSFSFATFLVLFLEVNACFISTPPPIPQEQCCCSSRGGGGGCSSEFFKNTPKRYRAFFKNTWLHKFFNPKRYKNHEFQWVFTPRIYQKVRIWQICTKLIVTVRLHERSPHSAYNIDNCRERGTNISK